MALDITPPLTPFMREDYYLSQDACNAVLELVNVARAVGDDNPVATHALATNLALVAKAAHAAAVDLFEAVIDCGYNPCEP